MPFFKDEKGIYEQFKKKCDSKGIRYSFVFCQIMKKWIDED